MTRPGIPILMLGPYLRPFLTACVVILVIASGGLFMFVKVARSPVLRDRLIKAAVSATIGLFVIGLLYLVLHLLGMP